MKDQVVELRLYDTKQERYLDIYEDQKLLLDEACIDFWYSRGVDFWSLRNDMSIEVVANNADSGLLCTDRFKVIISSSIE
mgnify:CR=1 FL=1